jgi:hypothetical protein
MLGARRHMRRRRTQDLIHGEGRRWGDVVPDWETDWQTAVEQEVAEFAERRQENGSGRRFLAPRRQERQRLLDRIYRIDGIVGTSVLRADLRELHELRVSTRASFMPLLTELGNDILGGGRFYQYGAPERGWEAEAEDNRLRA